MFNEETNYEFEDEDSTEDYFIFCNGSSDSVWYIFHISTLSNAFEVPVRETDNYK